MSVLFVDGLHSDFQEAKRKLDGGAPDFFILWRVVKLLCLYSNRLQK